jgi:hypothetical protein
MRFMTGWTWADIEATPKPVIDRIFAEWMPRPAPEAEPEASPEEDE